MFFSRLLSSVLYRQGYASLLGTPWKPSLILVAVPITDSQHLLPPKSVVGERDPVGQNSENLLTLRLLPTCQEKASF